MLCASLDMLISDIILMINFRMLFSYKIVQLVRYFLKCHARKFASLLFQFNYLFYTETDLGLIIVQ